jgi:hypothetical protein
MISHLSVRMLAVFSILLSIPILFECDWWISRCAGHVSDYLWKIFKNYADKCCECYSNAGKINASHFIQFSSKSLIDSDINITYENNYISKVNDLNFLGLNINNTLSWKTHIDKILPKLSSACFSMQAVKQFMSPQMLKAIYYSHFYSIISYGVIFWGHIAPSTRVFRLQKRIIRIMKGSRSKDSCRKLFTSLEILPLLSLYMFSLLRFVIKNKELFTTNNETHNYGTRQNLDFHYPSANLKKFQTGVHYMSVKIYNSLPIYIKNEINITKKFETLLKKFLLENSFYSLEEFYNFV